MIAVVALLGVAPAAVAAPQDSYVHYEERVLTSVVNRSLTFFGPQVQLTSLPEPRPGDPELLYAAGAPTPDGYFEGSTAEVTGPLGEPLRPGVYPDAHKPFGLPSNLPGIHVGYSNISGCSGEDSGAFEIKELERDAQQKVVRLWMLWDHQCVGGSPTHSRHFGEVRIGMPPEPGQVQIAPHLVRWPVDDAGHAGLAVPVTVLARGATTITSAQVLGDNPEAFEVTADACRGRTLAAGERCAVQVRLRAPLPGTKAAVLRITEADGTVHDAALQGHAFGGRTELRTEGDPGEFTTNGGQSETLTPADARFELWGSPQQLSFAVHRGPPALWQVRFGAPAGTALAPGRFAPAGDIGQTPAILDVQHGASNCQIIDGEFTVRDVTFDGARPSSFGADFRLRCDTGTEQARGSLNWRVGNTVPQAPWLAERRGPLPLPSAPAPPAADPAPPGATPPPAAISAALGATPTPTVPPARPSTGSSRRPAARILFGATGLRASSTGRIRLRVACTAPAGTACRGTLSVANAGSSLLRGRPLVTVPSGATRVVTAHLSPRALRDLRARRRMAVSVRLRGDVVATRTVTLRGAPRQR